MNVLFKYRSQNGRALTLSIQNGPDLNLIHSFHIIKYHEYLISVEEKNVQRENERWRKKNSGKRYETKVEAEAYRFSGKLLAAFH